MAAQVEVQSGEVGRTGAGGLLHLSPLGDSSNKSVIEIPSMGEPHILGSEANKPAPNPKPRLTPKPFAVEKNPTIKPILAPKPQAKPRPESTRTAASKPDLPHTPKPAVRPVSSNPNRPASTSFRTPSKFKTGQTSKPVVQPFKPAPPLDPGEPSKSSRPVPTGRHKPAASNLAYSKSLKTYSAAEWPGSPSNKHESGPIKEGPITRAKSMDFLAAVGQDEEEKNKAQPAEAVQMRAKPRNPRPRPVSTIFPAAPAKTETPVPVPRLAARRPLSADLTSKFESIGLSLHRKSPKANTPTEQAPPPDKEQDKTPPSGTPAGADGAADRADSDQNDDKAEEPPARDAQEAKPVTSIKSRISLLLDSSCPPGAAADLPSPVQPVPEAETSVGVKQLIKQLTEDTTPTPPPAVKPVPKPRPLPLDLTKKFSSERSPDPVSVSEAADGHDISKDPQRGTEEPTSTPSEQKMFLDLKDSPAEFRKAFTPDGTEAGQESGSGAEPHTVKASLFDNIVERQSVLMMDQDDSASAAQDSPGSAFSVRSSDEGDGSLVTATYLEPASPSNSSWVSHAFDTVQAAEENRAVSESVPAAQWEDKAMTLRSRRSERTRPGIQTADPAPVPDLQPRYLRIGALQKWTASDFDDGGGLDNGMLKQSERDGQAALEKDQDEVAAAPKRLKMLQAEEQQKPRATYFALTGQMPELAPPGGGGSSAVDANVLFSDLSVRSTQGQLFSARRNPSLEEAFGIISPTQEKFDEFIPRSHIASKEVRSPMDKPAKDDMTEVKKRHEPERRVAKTSEAEREKQKQLETEKQAHADFERMKEWERQREFERQRQRAFEMEKKELEEKQQRQKLLEKQKQQESEERRQRQLQKEKRELEKQKETEAQQLVELERQRLREKEAERLRQMALEQEMLKIKELERKAKQKEIEMERQKEMERRRELEKQRQRDLEKEKKRKQDMERQQAEKERLRREQEQERKRKEELERLKEMERQQLAELEKQRARERAEKEAEKLRQMALEQEMLRIRELEKERVRQKELEMERQLEIRMEKERELEKQRQRQLDTERQQLENERLRREQEQERKRKEELERLREMERLQLVELERQRLREKEEREAEKLRQVALEQEMLKIRELEKERARQKELEMETRELEKRRQRETERERQRQLDLERQQFENERLRREQEKDRQRKELERLREAEKVEKAEAERMRHIAKQQEAERQRLKEKQKKEEQERLWLESCALRPKVLDLDSVHRSEPLSPGSPQHSNPSPRWREPYKPAILDIDSFTSHAQGSPSKDPSPSPAVLGPDAEFGARSLPTAERDVSWKVPPQTSGGFSTPVWTTSPQDPWELVSVEMSVDKPVTEPRKAAGKLSPEQLLLKQEERLASPQRHRPAFLDEPLFLSPPQTRVSPQEHPHSSPADQVWVPREPQPPKERRGEGPGYRRSHGAQELNRMRSRSMSRRSAPSSSAVEGILFRKRSRSAHRELDLHSVVQQKQSGEADSKDSGTPVRDTDSQYGTWETGLHTDDSSLTPATTSPGSNLSPSPRKTTPLPSPGDQASQPEHSAPNGPSPSSSSESQPLNFPDAPTTLLDNSALRSRAHLGKKRAPRTRPSKAARLSGVPAQGDGENKEDWLYKDSTEAKAENKDDDSESEEPAKGADAGPAVPSQPQRVALFPGVDASALKAQLKKRGDSDNQPDGPVPSPSHLSRSPKSPFLPRAARVLPPPGGKENGEEDSPQWLKELKSKKRLSHFENES
ncbi:protein PRRC2C isoform X1 [Fundulus heteroclitus]|uniref:protein PRRC2C isoform X1 n=1 Tax=Fundulus heteroclitus TaxID=8078 RepID=UPI00165B2C0A|nr:protein PRRC2C isoform X1 [Fundulus heteroclitus]XP_036000478.1 protein PRRC2C isoform X1 [Fundulus heteroclitus]